MRNERKYLHFLIVGILKAETDRKHTMTQAQLMRALREAGLEVNRTTLERAVADLIAMQEYSRIHYAGEAAEAESEEDEDKRPYYTGLWYEQEFSDAELKWVIDGTLYSRNVPHADRDELIGKLVSLGGKSFRERNSMKKIRRLSPEEPVNPELFENIEKISLAIEKGCKIKAVYNYMNEKFELEPAGGWGHYHQLLNPYALVMRGGFYYLVCNNNKYDDLTHYRVDRMTDILVLEGESAKPVRELAPFKNKSWDLREYMEQNINMAFGEPERITFLADRKMVPAVIDSFGRGVEFREAGAGQVECVVHVPAFDMLNWALQNCASVRVTAPETLVNRIEKTLRKALDCYDGV